MADNITAKDGNGNSFTLRSTDLGGGVQVTHHRLNDGAGNNTPAMDAAARAAFFKHTDGANTMPAGDAKARRIWMQPTDGTNDFLSATAANMSALSAANASLVNPPGEWAVNHTPGAAAQATASKAAGAAGVRHICKSISATLATAGTAQAAAAILNLRDGATGAGTILWSKQVILPVNGVWEVNITGLNVIGTAATAMTLEFAAAGVAGSFESVSMSGTDTV